jgi:hypothetical protein
LGEIAGLFTTEAQRPRRTQRDPVPKIHHEGTKGTKDTKKKTNKNKKLLLVSVYLRVLRALREQPQEAG